MLARHRLHEHCCCSPCHDLSTLGNLLRVPESNGPLTPTDAEGDIDAVAVSGSSMVTLALGTVRHHYAASASFLYLHFLALAYQRGKGSVAYIPGKLVPSSQSQWWGSWSCAQPFLGFLAFIRTREMGEAGVCTSGCILGPCQYVSGCHGLYQPGSRHWMQAWVGMFLDVHKDSGSRVLLQRNRLPDSVMLPREKEQRTRELATCLFRTV